MGQSGVLAVVAQRPNRSLVPLLQADAQGFLIPGSFAGGKSLFVNATTGSDSDGDGSVTSPFATLDAALAAATANSGDTVYFRGTQARTATLTWNKNGVNLIGLNAPSNNGRARITGGGSTAFTPLVNVTAQGCRFENVGTFYGYADASAQVCWAEAGGRNYYNQCQFLGGGNATAAAQLGMRSLTITGEGENVFNNCTLGLNTVDRSVANATLEFLGANGQRNIFYNPVFQMRATNAGVLHLKAATGSFDREQVFFNPVFLNSIGSGATPITADCSVAADAGGAIILMNPMSVGAGKISAAGPVYVQGPVPTAGTTGLGVAAS